MARRSRARASWYQFDYLVTDLPGLAQLVAPKATLGANGAVLHSGHPSVMLQPKATPISTRARPGAQNSPRCGADSIQTDPSLQTDHFPPTKPCRQQVAAGKATRAYSAHSYPTKVPPEAIEPYIEYYTRPGEVVLDPFCGSGMTGLAARRRGRRAVLNDLSPLAAHLAYNHATRCDPASLAATWNALRDELAEVEDRHYGIDCVKCKTRGLLHYVIWSDVYACPHCARETVLWHGINQKTGTVAKTLKCAGCRTHWRKSAESRVRVEPVWAAYECGCGSSLRQRALTPSERRTIEHFPAPPASVFVPQHPITSDREMYQRSALHLRGVRTVADLYTPRNLSALAILWEAIRAVQDRRVRLALAFAFTNTAWHGTRMRRFNARGGHRPLTGTLYIPQLSSEANIFQVFDHKIAHLTRFFADLEAQVPAEAPAIHLGSAAELDWVPDASVDYVFTDPPFGSNIFYADCNLIAEAWLGCLADFEREAVVNRSRRADQGGKSLAQYGAILERAFAEMHRVLKPGRWATVVFQSSDGAVWHTIAAAAEAAGFEAHDAHTLDKVQQSMKGYKGRSGAENVASFDIVLHLRKAVKSNSLTRTAPRRANRPDQRAMAIASVLDHLAALGPSAATERTLPFLYSLSVERLLNAGISLKGYSMEMLRDLLRDTTEERDGRWFTLRARAVR